MYDSRRIEHSPKIGNQCGVPKHSRGNRFFGTFPASVAGSADAGNGKQCAIIGDPCFASRSPEGDFGESARTRPGADLSRETDQNIAGRIEAAAEDRSLGKTRTRSGA